MLTPLQGLRVLFAIMIFFHHLEPAGTSMLYAGGDCAVVFFFMLSGYTLAYGYHKRCQSPQFSYRRFIGKRMIRIYPMHLTILIAVLLLSATSAASILNKPNLANLLLLQAWIPNSDYFFSGNTPSWFLSALASCYIIFPPLCRFIFRSQKLTLFIIGASTLIIYLICAEVYHGANALYYFYICPVTRCMDFTIGILLCRIFTGREAFPKLTAKIYSCFEMLALLLLVAAFLIHPYVGEIPAYALIWWLPIALMILLFSLSRGFLSRIMHHPVAMILGGYSFSFFMVHKIIITLFSQWAFLFPWEVGSALSIAIQFTIACICAMLIYHYVERPSIRLSSRILPGRQYPVESTKIIVSSQNVDNPA